MKLTISRAELLPFVSEAFKVEFDEKEDCYKLIIQLASIYDLHQIVFVFGTAHELHGFTNRLVSAVRTGAPR